VIAWGWLVVAFFVGGTLGAWMPILALQNYISRLELQLEGSERSLAEALKRLRGLV